MYEYVYGNIYICKCVVNNMQKKVTLSIESRTYEEFRRFCEENAIMLSKKVEIFMKDSLKAKKSKIVTSIFAILIIGFIASMVYAMQFSDLTQGDFNNGTYLNSVYSGDGIVLNGANVSGSFTSRVFDAGFVSNWKNLSWSGDSPQNEYIFAFDMHNCTQY